LGPTITIENRGEKWEQLRFPDGWILFVATEEGERPGWVHGSILDEQFIPVSIERAAELVGSLWYNYLRGRTQQIIRQLCREDRFEDAEILRRELQGYGIWLDAHSRRRRTSGSSTLPRT